VENPSMKKISSMLGIAPSTVSRALSGKPGVSESRRGEIIALAKELGYTPDVSASALRTGNRYGLTIVTLTHPTEITNKRNNILFKKGKDVFDTVTVVLSGEHKNGREVINEITRSKSKGVVLSGLGSEFAEAPVIFFNIHGISAVAIDSGIPELDSIDIDRESGMEEAVCHFLSSGCDNPLFLLPEGISEKDPRKKGITKGLGKYNKTPESKYFHYFSGSSFQTGYNTFMKIIKTRLPDALFAYNDHMALGVLRAAQEMGVKIPDDLILIGFDDVDFASFTSPSLTTVRQPLEECIEKALELLKSRIEAPEIPPRREVLPAKLVYRESAPEKN